MLVILYTRMLYLWDTCSISTNVYSIYLKDVDWVGKYTALQWEERLGVIART